MQARLAVHPCKLITKTSSRPRRAAGSTTRAAHTHLRSQGGILPRRSGLPPSSSGACPGDPGFSDQLRVEHIPLLRTRVSTLVNQQALKFLPHSSNIKFLLRRCRETDVPAVPCVDARYVPAPKPLSWAATTAAHLLPSHGQCSFLKGEDVSFRSPLSSHPSDPKLGQRQSMNTRRSSSLSVRAATTGAPSTAVLGSEGSDRGVFIKFPSQIKEDRAGRELCPSFYTLFICFYSSYCCKRH